jgi:hypothetical protein
MLVLKMNQEGEDEEDGEDDCTSGRTPQGAAQRDVPAKKRKAASGLSRRSERRRRKTEAAFFVK